jgi:glycosyltransferase involved in cell wall biosynthesis
MIMAIAGDATLFGNSLPLPSGKRHRGLCIFKGIMKLYGMLIAKNEGDIIEQTLLSLKEFGGFEKIFFYDNGSSDNTLNIARKFNDLVTCIDVSNTTYSDTLKYELLYSQAHTYANGDWMAILDADELYAESLLPKIDFAERHGANCIEAKSAQFYLTEKDNASVFDPSVEAIKQRKHYLINYGEPRLFKYSDALKLNDKLVKSRDGVLVSSAEKLLINHFQYRSSPQLQTRIAVRKANNPSSGNWYHVNSERWEDYLMRSKYLHEFDGTFKYGLPEEANLYKIENNIAYTNTTLKWLAQNNYFQQHELDFLEAGRFKRVLKKFF